MPRCHVFSHFDSTHIPRFNVDSFVNFGKCPFAQANSIRVLVEIAPPHPKRQLAPLTARAIDTFRRPDLQARGRHYCLRLARSLISCPQQSDIYI